MSGIEPFVLEIDVPVKPFDAFRAISHLPHPFFLDSGPDAPRPGGPTGYSFAGADPFLTVAAEEGRTVQRAGNVQRLVGGDPFEAIDAIARSVASEPGGGLPFSGGLVGYLGYDLCRFVEQLPRTVPQDVPMPDMFFGAYDAAIVFEHSTGRAFVVSTGLPERETAGRERARARAHWLRAVATEPPRTTTEASGAARGRRATIEASATRQTRPDVGTLAGSAGLRSNLTPEQYLASVRRAREYIFAGDIYQVNLSQRFEGKVRAEPTALYGALRTASPAPFGAYMDAGRFKILSNSPERFLRVDGRRVETRPIKGTQPRGEDGAADRALSEQLLASDKDAAEHLMIVDLERNDLGRVCEYGTVAVEELARLESFRHVHHLVSVISGELRDGVTCEDLLRATFPGGSITGAPKVRAMEIIDELEPTARGVYTGAIGYLSGCGSIDLNIAIRTLVYDGTTAYFQVGGGIVADSDPEAEYQETLDKAGAFFELLATAPSQAVTT